MSVVLTVVLVLGSGCKRNGAPQAPLLIGPSQGYVGDSLAFTVQTSDPDGDDVYYWFSWGTAEVGRWIGPFPDRTPVVVHHAYSDSGSYTVAVKARDKDGGESEWCAGLVVRVDGGYIPDLTTPNVTCAAVNNGAELRLTWGTVSGAEGYRIQTDDSIFATTAISFTVTSPTSEVSVQAYNSGAESNKWCLYTTAVITDMLEVYGISDPSPNHPCSFGFITDGTAVPYSPSPEHNPRIDFVMDDVVMGSMFFYSPNRYDPAYNHKDNAVAVAPGTDFDAATIASGDFFTVLGCVQGTLYYFWLDPNANGWDVTDHFGKMKVESISGSKVTLKLAYQKVPGLTWVKTH